MELLVDEQIDQDQTFAARGASLLTYPASIPQSTRSLVGSCPLILDT